MCSSGSRVTTSALVTKSTVKNREMQNQEIPVAQDDFPDRFCREFSSSQPERKLFERVQVTLKLQLKKFQLPHFARSQIGVRAEK